MSVQDSNLTTDAVPNRRNSITEKTKVNTDDVSEDEVQCSDEEVRTAKVRRDPFKSFSKFKKCRIPSAQATIINISYSNGVHVGDQYVYNATERSEKSSTKIKETNAIRTLKKSQKPLETDDLLFIAEHMNESWKDTMRELNFSDGQIEQCVLDHHHMGTKEVIYQLLLSWTQSNPENANFATLCTTLWNNNQQDSVKRLSEKKN